MQEDIEKSKLAVRKLIMKEHRPEQYAEEQAEKEKALAETLAFVEGIKAALAAQEKEAQKSILFKSNKYSPCGFTKQ